jgi:very-short-patch-repair endonuclease
MSKPKIDYTATFLDQYKQTNLPPLQQEVKFHETRKWKFDFAIVELKIAIEIEGGTWNYGRHTRPKGYQNDCNKYNAAQALGWKVFRFTTDDIINNRIIGFLYNYINPDEPLFV